VPDPRAQIPLELFAQSLLQFVHLAGECRGLPFRAASRRTSRALDLRRLAHHGVVTELPDLVFVERPAGEFLLPVNLFIEIDEDPHGPETTHDDLRLAVEPVVWWMLSTRGCAVSVNYIRRADPAWSGGRKLVRSIRTNASNVNCWTRTSLRVNADRWISWINPGSELADPNQVGWSSQNNQR